MRRRWFWAEDVPPNSNDAEHHECGEAQGPQRRIPGEVLEHATRYQARKCDREPPLTEPSTKHEAQKACSDEEQTDRKAVCGVRHSVEEESAREAEGERANSREPASVDERDRAEHQ